ncbi:MAG: NfeD family protein [Alphaproteobacteria bacterium]|nr:NfeD family protein [Alphaproteobacteria bacterium]
MDALASFYAMHPLWVWLAVAAAFLAVEVGTGTGWLLWPAVSAALVGVLTLALPLGPPLEIALFAVLTIATTYLARRFLRPVLEGDAPDLNDPLLRLIGRDGQVLSTFENGLGRVFVDGKEWQARLEGDPPLPGQRVQVLGVDGATLTVRAF